MAEPDETSLASDLAALPGVYVRAIEPRSEYAAAFELGFVQAVDHEHPDRGKFVQRVFLSHRGSDRPTVIRLAGYEVTWPKANEVADLLGANLVEVEHRYFGSSRPGGGDWKYLTIAQAAADHHRVIEVLRAVYPGRWVSTGRSKGGQAAIFHRSYYPADVERTIAFVAPLMASRRDPRFREYLVQRVGEDTVAHLEDVRATCASARDHVLAEFSEKLAATATYLPAGTIVDWTLSELPFAWYRSRQTDSGAVPGQRNSESLPQPEDRAACIRFCLSLMVPGFYGERRRETQYALHHQTAAELGFAGYPAEHMDGLTGPAAAIDCGSLGDPTDHPDFDPLAMPAVLERLQRHGPALCLVYGAHDLWTAAAVDPAHVPNLLRIDHPSAGHDVKISDLDPEHRRIVEEFLTSPADPERELAELVAAQVGTAEAAGVRSAFARVSIPGLALERAAGLEDGENETLTSDHAFKIASIAKMMTATVALQLVEEHRLDLDAPFASYLTDPSFDPDEVLVVGGQQRGGSITVRMLLTHTSGLADYMEDPRFVGDIAADPGRRWSPERIMATYFGYGTNLQEGVLPGQEYRYADPNYVLLALVLESVSGQPVPRLYRQRIFEPLGMTHTWLEHYEEPPATSPPLAHAWFGDIDLVSDVDTSFDWGGGGIATTASDLEVFFRALFGGRLFRSADTLAKMLVTSGPSENHDHEYGMGIMRRSLWGHTVYGHGGAYDCDAYFDPETGLFVFTTLNQMDTAGRRDPFLKAALAIGIELVSKAEGPS